MQHSSLGWVLLRSVCAAVACLALVVAHLGCQSGSSTSAAEIGHEGCGVVAAGFTGQPQVARTVLAAAPIRGSTDRGQFHVEWSPAQPIVLNQPFELECQVTHVSGDPAQDAEVNISAWMPAHRHGTVRQPKTMDEGGGRYRVSGLLLHMEGHWELLVDIGFQSKYERAKFDVILAPAAAPDAMADFSAEEVGRVLALSPLPEPPDDPTNAYDLDERAARLGQFLFFDAQLSKSGETSCASCHIPERGWSDGKELASAEGQLSRRTMPLWNVAHQRWLFWDGRADSLWSQSLQPLEDPREMANDRVAIARRLAQDAEVRRAYEAIFGELPPLDDAKRFPDHAKPDLESPDSELAQAWESMSSADREAIDRTLANVGKSLAAFQRKIVSQGSAFDDFVAGLRDGDAATVGGYPEDARRGLKLFLGRANCHLCHSGPNFTDLEFHDTRLPRSSELPLDLGRFGGVMRLQRDPFNGVGPYADAEDAAARSKLEHLPIGGQVWGEFRTPTLRGVGAGGPYMHQGQFTTLEEVIDFYSDQVSSRNNHGELDIVLQPVGLSQDEKSDLAAFLRTLTGASLPESLLRQPPTPSLE